MACRPLQPVLTANVFHSSLLRSIVQLWIPVTCITGCLWLSPLPSILLTIALSFAVFQYEVWDSSPWPVPREDAEIKWRINFGWTSIPSISYWYQRAANWVNLITGWCSTHGVETVKAHIVGASLRCTYQHSNEPHLDNGWKSDNADNTDNSELANKSSISVVMITKFIQWYWQYGLSTTGRITLCWKITDGLVHLVSRGKICEIGK